MIALTIEEVFLTYPGAARPALDGVSLAVPAGSALGVVGESGSGKSSLARVIAGLARPSRGRVLLGALPLARAWRAGPSPIQLIFQNPQASLDPCMSIGESVAEALPALGRQARVDAVRAHLAMVGLGAELIGSRPRQLSGGQRQRVAIARALAARPQVLVADEITSALDVSVQASILNLVARLRSELGFTLVFISHNLAAVRYVCDEIAVMLDGRVVEQGRAEQVIGAPRTPYTRELLDATPRLDPPPPRRAAALMDEIR